MSWVWLAWFISRPSFNSHLVLKVEGLKLLPEFTQVEIRDTKETFMCLDISGSPCMSSKMSYLTWFFGISSPSIIFDSPSRLPPSTNTYGTPHLCLGMNFSLQLKQRLFSRRRCISSQDNFFITGVRSYFNGGGFRNYCQIVRFWPSRLLLAIKLIFLHASHTNSLPKCGQLTHSNFFSNFFFYAF